MKFLTALVGFTVLVASKVGAEPADVASAVASPDRPAGYIALDEHRKPIEVLQFLGLRRGDRVLDYEAGGGYYTEIIAKAVGCKGLVVGSHRPFFFAQARVQSALANLEERAPNAINYVTDFPPSFLPESFDFVSLSTDLPPKYSVDSQKDKKP